jgi:hypothetical protein
MLVFVSYHKSNRGAGCFAFIDSGQKLHSVGFFSGRRYAGLSGTASVEFALNEGQIKFHTGGAAVDYSS